MPYEFYIYGLPRITFIGDRKFFSGCLDLGVGGRKEVSWWKLGVTANVYLVSLGENEHILNLIVRMVVQL